MAVSIGSGMRMLVVFDIPAYDMEKIRAIAPGMHIDQLRREDPGYIEALQAAHIIVGWPGVRDLSQARELKWLQIASAGANNYVENLPPGVTLTNASGVFGVPIAEHVLAMMLSFVRGIPGFVRSAIEAQWQRQPNLQELYENTCGIVGLGDIGSEVAKRAKALGMRVVAVKRTLTPKPDYVDTLLDIAGLDELMATSQHVVITLPGTPHTKHLIDARRLGLMPKGAYIYNIGRGSVIDEEALVAALQSGHLGGAGLDVFEREPLPAESPLWSMPNVIITPHNAGTNPRHGERLASIVLRNLPRFLAGEPLENEVDSHWGY